MEIVTVFLQIFEKAVTLFPAKTSEEFGASFENIDTPSRLVVAQALTGQPVICAKIGIGFHRGAVGVERENIGRHGARIIIARVPVDAVEDRIKVVRSQQSLILEENIYGSPACCAHWERQQLCFVKTGDSLTDSQMFHDFAEIATQHTRPAKRVNAVPERSRDQFVKTVHQLNAVIAGRQPRYRPHG